MLDIVALPCNGYHSLKEEQLDISDRCNLILGGIESSSASCSAVSSLWLARCLPINSGTLMDLVILDVAKT